MSKNHIQKNKPLTFGIKHKRLFLLAFYLLKYSWGLSAKYAPSQTPSGIKYRLSILIDFLLFNSLYRRNVRGDVLLHSDDLAACSLCKIVLVAAFLFLIGTHNAS